MCSLTASAEPPLYEQEPYDQVTLDAANNNEVIKIKPLEIAKSYAAAARQVDRQLKVRRLDKPDKEYKIVAAHRQARTVRGVDPRQGQPTKRPATLRRLTTTSSTWRPTGPICPAWPKRWKSNLYREAGACKQNGQYDAALALLRETFEHNRRRPGLDNAMGRVTDQLLANYAKENNYPAVRSCSAIWPTAIPKIRSSPSGGSI